MRNVSGRVRVALDFKTPEAAIWFVDWLKSVDVRYENADAFAMDGLDTSGSSGITVGNTYLVKNGRDRIPGSALRDLWDGKHEYKSAEGLNLCTECEGPSRSPLHRTVLKAAGA